MNYQIGPSQKPGYEIHSVYLLFVLIFSWAFYSKEVSICLEDL